jgi:hypothetical protein
VAVALAVPAHAQSPEDLTGLIGELSPSGQSLPADLQRGASGPAEPVFEALAGDGCDELDAKRCLLPFPNDRFTTTDATTPTGLRVDLDVAAMPRNVAGLPIRPDEWNRNDGFSPGAMALTHVPGLDLEGSFGLEADDFDETGVAQLRAPALSLHPDAPIVLLNADTGERHPYVAELDTHPDTPDDQRLLIVRPLANLDHGNRYVVALRGLVDHEGEAIAASDAFATVRDELPESACDPEHVDEPGQRPGNRPDHAGGPDARPGERPDHAGGPGQRPGDRPACDGDLDGEAGRYQRIFADLAHAGVDRDGLYLAWDFTVASADNVTGRARHMRDVAFEQLGDTDLAEGHPADRRDPGTAGRAPTYEITEIEQRGDDLAIRGTVEVPSFLTLPQDLPRVPPDGLEEHLGTGVQQYLPGSRLYYGTPSPAAMDLPQINPVAPTMDAEFACFLPDGATADAPARPTLYGHGLLGGLGEVGGGSTALLRGDNHLICGTPWIGMSTEDVANVGTILADMGNFPSLADRAQQGFVNFLFLGRLMAHEDGFAADPVFQDELGAPRIDTTRLVYDGNSQGGIMGGALTALATDFTRAVLGVPGGNYSTLLNRSVDWEGAYGEIAYAFYPDKADQQLKFALIQMLWDRAETNGYAHFMSDEPLPGTPAHRVLLQAAWADHQVANLAAEVDARTAGARLLQTSLAPDRHWADVSGQRTFGLETFDVDDDGRPAPLAGSALVYVDSGNAMPPHGNTPPRDGGDPHGDPRSDAHAHEQRVRFFDTGLVHDTRDGAPYWSGRCRGPHNPEACDEFQPW